MTKLEFQALCRDCSRVLGLPDLEQLGRDGRIELREHSIGVFYDEDRDTALQCYVDLGPLASDDRLRMLEQVLALNLELGRMHGESLGLDLDSGHLILRSDIPPSSSCTPVLLAEWLHDYVEFANEFPGLLNQAGSMPLTDVGAQLA